MGSPSRRRAPLLVACCAEDTMIPLRCPRPMAAVLTLATAALLTACGGGGGADAGSPGGAPAGEPGAPPTGPAAPAAPALVASSGTAATALVQWQDATGTGPWTLERLRDGDAAAQAVIPVTAAAGAVVDTGLAAATPYRYRLRDAAGAVLAEATATTGREEALVADWGAAQGPAQARAIGAQAGEAAAGEATLRFEAGTFAAAGTATLTPHANPLADGIGPAWAIELDQRPQQAMTVAIAYGADEDADAVEHQRLAVRQADGSWWMLAAWNHDRAARRLTAVIPPGLVPPADMTAAPSSPRARAAAAASPARVVIQLVRFVGVKLLPREAGVRVLGSVLLQPVAAWDVREDACDMDPGPLCVPGIGLVRRDLPITNNKAGYQRRWLLEGSTTPDPALGMLTAAGASGVVYRAPATVPATNPVTLRFESVHTASGRRMAVSARVRITEDAWVGPMTLSNSADGIGYYYDADTRWVLDPSRSSESVRYYRAQGRVTLHIESGACGLVPSPASAELGPAAGFTDLEVDEITGRYHLQLNAMWPATLRTCLGTPMPTSVGVTFDQHGSLAADRLRGSQQEGPIHRVWNLARPQ
ncbi:hypothetical protein V4F39_16495 [Aquincola sp. MAHUQ-54]|uniref:Fibronectin type-III domain-containing protein n=2 Tax=Sphaerotilaceae TaxID=2975441 RepID=A0AAW9QDS4_9BURK